MPRFDLVRIRSAYGTTTSRLGEQPCRTSKRQLVVHLERDRDAVGAEVGAPWVGDVLTEGSKGSLSGGKVLREESGARAHGEAEVRIGEGKG